MSLERGFCVDFGTYYLKRKKMQVLDVQEIDEVSGGNFWANVAAGVVATAIYDAGKAVYNYGASGGFGSAPYGNGGSSGIQA